jgi:hypothetical protein
MSPSRPRKDDAKVGMAVRKHHDRLVEQWRNMRRLYLEGADLRDTCRTLGKRQDRLLQGPFGAATASCLHEEGERPRSLRSLEKKAIDAGGAG